MDRKFKIPSVPHTVNKGIRVPNDLVKEVEDAIRGKNCTFSAFVREAVRSAINDIREDFRNGRVGLLWIGNRQGGVLGQSGI